MVTQPLDQTSILPGDVNTIVKALNSVWDSPDPLMREFYTNLARYISSYTFTDENIAILVDTLKGRILAYYNYDWRFSQNARNRIPQYLAALIKNNEAALNIANQYYESIKDIR